MISDVLFCTVMLQRLEIGKKLYLCPLKYEPVMENLELLVAKKLLQLKTFSLQVNSPFIWANNRKSPVYFDDRKIFSYTYMRNFIKLELAKTVAELYPDADVIAGVAGLW